MFILYILCIIVQSQIITGSSTNIDIQQPKKMWSPFLDVLHKLVCTYSSDDEMLEKKESCCFSIFDHCFLSKTSDKDDKTENNLLRTKESVNSRNSATVTTKIFNESNDLPAITTSPTPSDGFKYDPSKILTKHNESISRDEDNSANYNNNDREKPIGPRILLIILSGIVLITIAIFCITGIHWLTHDMLIRRDRRRSLRNGHLDGDNHHIPLVVTVSSNYRPIGLDDSTCTTDDCLACAVQLNHPNLYNEVIDTENALTIKTPLFIDDSPPPSYDECVSFIQTRPQSRELPTNEIISFRYSSV